MSGLAIVNQKGGVGKTTLATSLGALFAQTGEATVLVDLDPHASLTAYFRIDAEPANGGAYALFKHDGGQPPDLESLALPTQVPQLSLVPATSALATVERQAASTPGLGLVLRQTLARTTAFTHIIVDTPPTLGILMVNALAASDIVLLPVQTDYLALHGLELACLTLERMRTARGWHLPQMVIPTFYDRRTRASREGLEALKRGYAETLWQGVIPVDSSIRNASAAAVPCPLYRPRGRAAGAYETLFRDVRERLALPTPAPA